ncbi:MAG: hypothetical protein RIF41_11465 [Polyangiaceae bacterium]
MGTSSIVERARVGALIVMMAGAVWGCDKLRGGDAEETGGGSDAEEEPAEEPAKDGATYTGTWKTPWGPVKLVQTGKQLSGSYTGSFTGTLEGTVEDGVADVGWTQTNGEHGRARFTIAADGESFKGTWGSNASATNGGPWNGERKKGGGGLL